MSKLAALLLGFAIVAPLPASAAPACGQEYHQLDFWIGDWDTFESEAPKGESIARTRVEPVAEGCALRERYEQTDGLTADALLSYDPVARRWQQTWVTNRGSLMVLTGGFEKDVLVLEGDAHLQDGRTVRQRIRWAKTADGVREWADASTDGGATWEPAFDVLFRLRQAP